MTPTAAQLRSLGNTDRIFLGCGAAVMRPGSGALERLDAGDAGSLWKLEMEPWSVWKPKMQPWSLWRPEMELWRVWMLKWVSKRFGGPKWNLGAFGCSK